eukprot:TRINITY_DN6434_c0_g1_i1.p1 TRINITY_DN6434_c0_g1~~TRINITY_DN6434_c0_g1_i1.p1  ORF type:complete len:737 (+),score=169.84 TRINITY_DN6434_c0_g1_i1:85-2211(+)
MAYNFGTTEYAAQFGNLPEADGAKLRKDTAEYLRKFNRRSWYDHPVKTQLFGETLHEGAETTTVDAFNRENGKLILASRHVVDQVIGHMRNYRVPRTDLRSEIRAIDWRFMTELAPEIIGNQSLDFEKQDGITEIEEAIQANLVEQRLNDRLFEAEARGEIEIKRDMVIVGCVSNFSNFLDLSRKTLRHLEVGVPCVVFSRSNTTQHMYRWFLILQDLLKEFNIDAGMLTYLSCSIEDQRRVMLACQDSPMHFTGSREVSAKIKEVCPQLIASTGGPNTLVATQYNDKVGAAVRMSNLIENKGQCTALRHFVCPGVNKGMMDKLYSDAPTVKSGLDSLEKGEFAGIFDFQKPQRPLPTGYSALESQDKVAVRISDALPPPGINEQWRQLFVDVTTPKTLDDAFLTKLSEWLNHEQPITLAINADDGYALAHRLFETTGLCVYTVGSLDSPGLTAQARPQDGEVFGELPPRHCAKQCTKLPMINPTPCAAYNSMYTDDYLLSKAQYLGGHGLAGLHEDAVSVLSSVKDDRLRGYGIVCLEYLLDACFEPKQGKTGPRTCLFGMQRPPIDGSATILRCENGANVDLLLLHALPFAATNAHEQVHLSLSSSAQSRCPEGTLRLLKRVFADRITVEDNAGFEKRAAASKVYNKVAVDDRFECLLAFQFMSLLFPMGHIKSTKKNDEAFVRAFKDSKKWLRVREFGVSRASSL